MAIDKADKFHVWIRWDMINEKWLKKALKAIDNVEGVRVVTVEFTYQCKFEVKEIADLDDHWITDVQEGEDITGFDSSDSDNPDNYSDGEDNNKESIYFDDDDDD